MSLTVHVLHGFRILSRNCKLWSGIAEAQAPVQKCFTSWGLVRMLAYGLAPSYLGKTTWTTFHKRCALPPTGAQASADMNKGGGRA